MRIVGNGFLARHLQSIAGRHDGVVALAAGVSAAATTSHEGFNREAALLYQVMRECMARGERLVFFSSASAGMYSVPGEEEGREDGPVYPATPYGRHKLALEAVLRGSPLDHIILRLSHVVGGHQPDHHLLPSLAEQIGSGRVRLFQGATRDLIDVDDVMAVIDTLLSAGVNREVVNVASGHATPVEAIVAHIERRLGVATKEITVAKPSQTVCVAKLRRLAPSVAWIKSDPDYFRRVLDKHIDAYAAVGVSR